MRVTTQMVNESARKAGLPINRNSLLNYINGGNGDNGLMQALQSKSAMAGSAANAKRYEKVKEAADDLSEQAEKFLQEGDKSLFGKAAESGDYSEVYHEIGKYISQYNDAIEAMRIMNGGPLNEFYRQSLQDAVADNKEALEAIGITVNKNGGLELDKDKLKAADVKDVEKVFGKSGKLSSKLAFIASRVSDNARANTESLTGLYGADGSQMNAKGYLGRYDSRG